MTEAARASLTRYTADRPLALVTDWPPDAGGGGAVILRSLLGPEDRAAARLDEPGRRRPTPTPLGRTPSRSARARPGGAAARSGSTARSTPAPLAREALAVAEARGARALWVVMHYAGVPIAARLARSGRLPLHLTVHDDPAFGVALRSRRYLALVPWIERDFARGDAAGVVGRRHRPGYGRAVSPPLRRRIDRSSTAPSTTRSHRRATTTAARNGLRVGVLGSTYGYTAAPGPGPRRRDRGGAAWASRRDCSSSAGATASSSGPSSPAGSRSSSRATSPRPRASHSCATASRST